MAKAKKPDDPPAYIPPVTMDDEQVKRSKKQAFRKAGSASRNQSNLLSGASGGSYGSGYGSKPQLG